jgi:plasmid replication initiation protein
MIFVSTDTIYSVAAELVPTTTDEYVVFDITEGADKVVIQDVSLINGKTNFTFTFTEPVEEITDIVFRFYHKDNYDIRKDIAVELHNKVRSIMFRNVDAGPYIADRMYKFDYYTDPVLT